MGHRKAAACMTKNNDGREARGDAEANWNALDWQRPESD